MSIQLHTNEFSIDSLGLIDIVTGLPVQASFSNQSFSSSDPAIFTSTIQSDPNTTKNQAVAEGSAVCIFSATASFQNSTGNMVSQDLTGTVDVQVIQVVTPDGVQLVLIQGTPQLQ